MTPGKDQIVLHASIGFKDALGAYATDHNTSMAEVIRQAVADRIGYDLSADPARSRTPKYATKEEQNQANLWRALLIRWGKGTASKLLLANQIEAAMVIARAVEDKDYETLELLKDASEESVDQPVE